MDGDNNNVYVGAQNLLHRSANNQDCYTTLKKILLALCESGDEELDGAYNAQSYAHSI